MLVKKGAFAKSKTGHDCNQIYVIIDCNDEYAYLVNGKTKPLDKPKKKKLRHIQFIDYMDSVIIEKINNNRLNNDDIKKAIKDYKASEN